MRGVRWLDVAPAPPTGRLTRLTRSLALFVTVSYFYVYSANGQAFLQNGQFFTKGLAISDAPFPGSPQHAGSNIVIAVELSGNGKIDQSAFIPGSGASTRYDSLEIYLVSAQTGSNFTVSNASALLSQEPGSTVKHLNWPIPSCISPGVYNLTYYESAHINNDAFFSITPIGVTVDNPNRNSDTSPCETLSNELQTQPQPDFAPVVNPYRDPQSPFLTSSTLIPGLPMPTVTVGTAGIPTQWTVEPSGTIVFGTGSVTTATIVVVSAATVTETVTTGQASVFTTTSTGLITSTITAIMGMGDATGGGFFPVNGAMTDSQLSLLGQFLLACSITIIVSAISM